MNEKGPPPETRGNDDDGESIVDEILDKDIKTVFENKRLVDPSTIVDQNRIYGRDEQLAKQARAFRDTLDGERPPDLLLYGPSGTGKTLTIKSVAKKVKERAAQQGTEFDFVSTNFKSMESHTLDRAVWKIGRQTARKAGVAWDVPQKGISTDRKYLRLYEIVDEHFDALVFILDEIDALDHEDSKNEPAYSRLLYSLSRAMDEEHVDTLISTVVITNHPKFERELDSRTGSSYNPTGITFSDYDAKELIEILERRRDAFKEDALEDGVIELVAAFAAQNEGDARRAIDLLRDSGELANEQASPVVTEDHVRACREEVKRNRVLEIVKGLSPQKKFALYSAAIVAKNNPAEPDVAPSPVVYKVYQLISNNLDSDIYTQETVNKHITKAETYGVLSSNKTSGGYKSGTGVYLKFDFVEPVDAVIETLEMESRLSKCDKQKLQEKVSKWI